jgi:hypothetical protein
MNKSRSAQSLHARKLGRHIVHLVASADVTRDAPMSPESEDSFTLAAGDSLGSQYSFGINMGPLQEYQDNSVMDVLPLLEDQDIEMEADVLENGSSSPQSQYSFGINSMPLPELEDDHVLPAAHIPGVQDEVLEYPPLQPAATLGAQECEVSVPACIEDLMGDLIQPTVHDKNFSKPSATPGNLRVDPAPPAKAEGVTGDCRTACSKSHVL